MADDRMDVDEESYSQGDLSMPKKRQKRAKRPNPSGMDNMVSHWKLNKSVIPPEISAFTQQIRMQQQLAPDAYGNGGGGAPLNQQPISPQPFSYGSTPTSPAPSRPMSPSHVGGPNQPTQQMGPAATTPGGGSSRNTPQVPSLNFLALQQNPRSTSPLRNLGMQFQPQIQMQMQPQHLQQQHQQQQFQFYNHQAAPQAFIQGAPQQYAMPGVPMNGDPYNPYLANMNFMGYGTSSPRGQAFGGYSTDYFAPWSNGSPRSQSSPGNILTPPTSSTASPRVFNGAPMTPPSIPSPRSASTIQIPSPLSSPRQSSSSPALTPTSTQVGNGPAGSMAPQLAYVDALGFVQYSSPRIAAGSLPSPSTAQQQQFAFMVQTGGYMPGSGSSATTPTGPGPNLAASYGPSPSGSPRFLQNSPHGPVEVSLEDLMRQKLNDIAVAEANN